MTAYREKLAAYLLDWDESLHPRDPSGQFAESSLSHVGDELSSSKAAPVGVPFRVLRIGSKAGALDAKNAGNADAVDDLHMRSLDDDGPDIGNTLFVYEVVLDEATAGYERYNRGEASPLPAVKEEAKPGVVGRHVRDNEILYSFPPNGKWKAQIVARVPVSSAFQQWGSVEERLAFLRKKVDAAVAAAKKPATLNPLLFPDRKDLADWDEDQHPRDDEGQFTTGWHLTDDPDFVPDPTRTPDLNSFGGDLTENKPAGIFVGRPEFWMQAHGYERPYVAEVEGRLVENGPTMHGSRDERFLKGPLRTLRVLTIDEYAREIFKEQGWVESHFDTRPYSKIPKLPPDYVGRSVSDMTQEERAAWEKMFKEWAGRPDGPNPVPREKKQSLSAIINLPDISDVSFPSMVGAIPSKPPTKRKRKRTLYKGVSLSRRPMKFEAKVLSLTEIPRRLDACRDTLLGCDEDRWHETLHNLAAYGASEVLMELVRQGAPARLGVREIPVDVSGICAAVLADRARAITSLRDDYESRVRRRRIGADRREALIQSFTDRRQPALLKRFASRATNEAFALGRSTAMQALRRQRIPVEFELAYHGEGGKFISKAEAVAGGEAIVDAVIQTAVMDTGTCDECAEVDGESMELGSDRQEELRPPYVKCLGGEACRCVQIALLSDGSEIDVDEIDEDTLGEHESDKGTPPDESETDSGD